MSDKKIPPSTRQEEGDSDAEIVERFRAGDRVAFDELWHRHEASIRHLAMRYLKNEDEARDLAQRAFMRAYEKLDSFRGESTFRTWLHRVAINLALSQLRGATTEWVPLEDDALFTVALETQKLVARELWQQVASRLDSLPPKQRLVLELRLFHDLSFEEISAVAGCSEDSAKANFHHAVKRIRELLPRPQ
jgi:RNA polymerase sigma-70 factor, ECF subfamily